MNGKFPDLSQSFHSLVPTLHPEEWPRKQGLLRLPAGLPQGGAPTLRRAWRLNLKLLPSKGRERQMERGEGEREGDEE